MTLALALAVLGAALAFSGSLSTMRAATLNPPACDHPSLDGYAQVLTLLQEGRRQDALARALTIASDHLRSMALILIERSRPIR